MYQAGLVLEGGGMKGVYTAGVLDFFLDKKITFANCYGVSMGACTLCKLYFRTAGQRAQRCGRLSEGSALLRLLAAWRQQEIFLMRKCVMIRYRMS